MTDRHLLLQRGLIHHRLIDLLDGKTYGAIKKAHQVLERQKEIAQKAICQRILARAETFLAVQIPTENKRLRAVSTPIACPTRHIPSL